MECLVLIHELFSSLVRKRDTDENTFRDERLSRLQCYLPEAGEEVAGGSGFKGDRCSPKEASNGETGLGYPPRTMSSAGLLHHDAGLGGTSVEFSCHAIMPKSASLTLKIPNPKHSASAVIDHGGSHGGRRGG